MQKNMPPYGDSLRECLFAKHKACCSSAVFSKQHADAFIIQGTSWSRHEESRVLTCNLQACSTSAIFSTKHADVSIIHGTHQSCHKMLRGLTCDPQACCSSAAKQHVEHYKTLLLLLQNQANRMQTHAPSSKTCQSRMNRLRELTYGPQACCS